MKRTFWVLIIFITPIFSEDLKIEIFNEAMNHYNASAKLRTEGKKIKAEREFAEGNAILKKYIKANKRMSLPEGCTFKIDYDVKLVLNCNTEIAFILDAPDKAILENIQDCTESCTGDFMFVPSQRPYFELFSGMLFARGASIYCSVRFIKVKQVTKLFPKMETENK